VALALTAVGVVACELAETTVPIGESFVVVSAVMRPDVSYQYVIVERSFSGTSGMPDTAPRPIPPYAPIVPVEGATVTVRNLDLPGDLCGASVVFGTTPGAPGKLPAPGLYWAPANCPTMRPGDRLELTVDAPGGDRVTGVTRVPGMTAAYLARGADSVMMGGGDSVLTFNRDRDTLAFGVAPLVGRLLQLEIRRNGDLTDYGTKVHVDTTTFLLPGNAVNVFVSGAGQDVFQGGRSYVVTLTLADTNYFDYARSRNNEFTGRGFINRLTGGIGVFGSAVSATSRVWVVADMDDPREGLFHLTGMIVGDPDTVTIDAQLRVYLHRAGTTGEASAFLEGEYFRLNESPGLDAPEFVTRVVAGKSVDGAAIGERLHFVVSDTLPSRSEWVTTLDGVFTGADSIPISVADSTFRGALPLGTLVAVRQR
jgi:hypothetical protein